MTNTLILTSVVETTLSNGTTVYKLRFYEPKNKFYVYDTIAANSIRLEYLLKSVNAASTDVATLLNRNFNATLKLRTALNRADNTPFTQYVVDKYLGGTAND